MQDYLENLINKSTDALILNSMKLKNKIILENDKDILCISNSEKDFVLYGMVIKDIKNIAKDNEEYSKTLLTEIGYEKQKKLTEVRNYMESFVKNNIESGGFDCPRSGVDCEKDDKMCALEKYAQAVNIVHEVLDKYNLEDYILETIIYNNWASRMICNPNMTIAHNFIKI